jgi:hypothetical protein
MEPIQSFITWLLQSEEAVVRKFGDHLHVTPMKVTFTEQAPWILCSAVVWAVTLRIYNENAYFVSSVHAIIVSAMAMLNIYLGVDDHMEEYLFSLMAGYFLADYFMYCLRKEFAIYGLHHLLTVFALYRTINGVNWNSTLFASKCVLFEISTPFLNHYKIHKTALSGALFVVSFFFIRVVWLGYLAFTGMQVSLNKLEHFILISFTMLNYYWFVEIILKAMKASKELSDDGGSSKTNKNDGNNNNNKDKVMEKKME